jgi:hypothetical protein
LKAAGFTGPDEFRGNDLIFKFHRHAPPVHHFLEIQFDKRGGPKFLINFSEDTDAGIAERLSAMRQVRGEASLDLLENLGGKRGGILTAGRVPYFKTYLWFNTAGPYCKLRAVFSRRAPAEALADQIVTLFHSELEAWWSRRRCGTHLHITEHWSSPCDTSWRARMMRTLVWLYCLYGFAVTGWLALLAVCWPIGLLVKWIAMSVARKV